MTLLRLKEQRTNDDRDDDTNHVSIALRGGHDPMAVSDLNGGHTYLRGSGLPSQSNRRKSGLHQDGTIR